MLRVIFLDVDGVLNSRNTIRITSWGNTFVETALVENLKQIIKATGAKVVLSSSWRYDRDDPVRNTEFLELRSELEKHGIQFFGFTPELHDRSEDIDQWLTQHPETENFVILDDSNITLNQDHWVKTTMSHGLGQEETNQAIRILLDHKLADEWMRTMPTQRKPKSQERWTFVDRLGRLLRGANFEQRKNKTRSTCHSQHKNYLREE